MNKIVRSLYKKNNNELKIELLNLLREKFVLRTKMKMGQLKSLHFLKKKRYDIAYIKTCLFIKNKKNK